MLTPPCLIDTVIWFQIWVSYLLCSYECTTVVIEARPSGAGAEDSEHSVVGSLGSGKDSDDSEVDSQGEGGGVEQQVGSPGRLRRLTGLAHLLLHASAFTLFVDLIVVLVLPFAHLADHFVLLVLGPRTGRPSFDDHSRVHS